MKKISLLCVFCIVAACYLCSCASAPEPVQPAEPVQAEPAAPPPPPPEPEKTPAPMIETEDPALKITQEQYDQTFAEVEAVINDLNVTIKAKNMRKWESYLTPKFRSSVMSPGNLAELNDMPLLKRNNIKITTLKDYFDYVVVPSRANVRLDDLKFTDESRVQAFMKISKEESVLIYQLEKIDKSWKVSVW